MVNGMSLHLGFQSSDIKKTVHTETECSQTQQKDNSD